MTATALWAAVVVSYDEPGLIQLTNVQDSAATAIDTTIGEDAAQAVIDLWPAYAQVVFDASDALHVQVGKEATIAVLWKRGGTATSIEKVKWDEVFTDGMVQALKLTGPRGRQGPSSNSGIVTSTEQRVDGRSPLGWSDPQSLPLGLLPSGRGFQQQ